MKIYTYSEDDDCNQYVNGCPLVKQRGIGIGKRWSAQEAAKKLKRHFTTSPDEDEEGVVPNYVQLSQERISKDHSFKSKINLILN